MALGRGLDGLPRKTKRGLHRLRKLRNELLHDFADTNRAAGSALWDLYELLAKLIPGRGHVTGST
jgi:hypothetical protein